MTIAFLQFIYERSLFRNKRKVGAFIYYWYLTGWWSRSSVTSKFRESTALGWFKGGNKSWIWPRDVRTSRTDSSARNLVNSGNKKEAEIPPCPCTRRIVPLSADSPHVRYLKMADLWWIHFLFLFFCVHQNIEHYPHDPSKARLRPMNCKQSLDIYTSCLKPWAGLRFRQRLKSLILIIS